MEYAAITALHDRATEPLRVKKSSFVLTLDIAFSKHQPRVHSINLDDSMLVTKLAPASLDQWPAGFS